MIINQVLRLQTKMGFRLCRRGGDHWPFFENPNPQFLMDVTVMDVFDMAHPAVWFSDFCGYN